MNDITHLQIYIHCSYVLSGTRESIQFKVYIILGCKSELHGKSNE